MKEDFIKDLKEFARATVKKYFTKEKFAEDMLDDGETQIFYEEDVLATGVKVMIMDTTGAKLPLPEGNYTLQDGSTFDIVDMEGTADNVVLAEAPAEEEAPAPVDEEMEQEAAPASQPKSVVETITKETHFNENEMKEYEELKEEFAALKKVNEELKKENEALKGVEAEKEEFSSVVTEPTNAKKAPKSTSFRDHLAEAKKHNLV
jgi:hypothetical protein